VPEPKCCPHCKRPFLPQIKAGPIGRRILAAVEAHPDGISNDDLVKVAYDGSYDGGPDNARVVIRVTIYRLNSQLIEQGCIIRSDSRGTGALYQLKRLDAR
jgi:hypothetical protein